MYKKDIEQERIARQKTAAQTAAVLQSLLQLNQMLMDEKVDVISATTIPIAVPSAAPAASTYMDIIDDDRTNAVARLFRLQKLSKKSEPVYSLISDHRTSTGGRQFIMQVEYNGEKATGTALNKRSSKRMAAENLLATIRSKHHPFGSGNRKALKRKAKRKVVLDDSKIVEQLAADGSALETDDLLLRNQDSAGRYGIFF